MEYLLFIFGILSFARCNAQLTCYECTINSGNLHNNNTKPCSQFDESERFEISCPYSTFCLKKSYYHELQGGKKMLIVERGCAPQKYNYHNYENNKWVEHSAVDGAAYKEGCFDFDDKGQKSSKSQYCYCSSNLCNSSKRTTEASFFHHTDTMAVIFIFNVVKFMRTVR